jgi:hypothetical protein
VNACGIVSDRDSHLRAEDPRSLGLGAQEAQEAQDATVALLEAETRAAGVGTSGTAARRLAHLLSVIGTPALFLHPADALQVAARAQELPAQALPMALDVSRSLAADPMTDEGLKRFLDDWQNAAGSRDGSSAAAASG